MTGDGRGGLFALSVEEAKRLQEYQLWMDRRHLSNGWCDVDAVLCERLIAWISRHSEATP